MQISMSSDLTCNSHCAALVVACFPKFFQKLGRKYTMMIGSGCFMLGAALQATLCPFTLSHTVPL